MKQFVLDRTGQTPVMDEVPTEKLPIYANETAAIAALSNHNVGDILATRDVTEADILSNLITKIAELEEATTPKIWAAHPITARNDFNNQPYTVSFDETIPAGIYVFRLTMPMSSAYLGTVTISDSNVESNIESLQRYILGSRTSSSSEAATAGIVKISQPTDTLYLYGYVYGNSDSRPDIKIEVYKTGTGTF